VNNSMLFMNTVLNAPASYLAIDQKIHGPNISCTNGETSSTQALITALNLIHTKQVQSAVAGGVDRIHPIEYEIRSRSSALSSSGKFPEGSRPFSRTANGIVMGEGAYILVLEDLAFARKQARKIHGIIHCFSSAGDILTRSESSLTCLQRTLSQAGFDPSDVGAIFAGANSSPEIDRTEASALSKMFGQTDTVITAIRGALGSCSATGGAQIIAACEAFQRKKVPPTLSGNTLVPGLRGVSGESQLFDPSKPILINDFNRSGQQFSLILLPD